jgi:uncharacterized protein
MSQNSSSEHAVRQVKRRWWTIVALPAWVFLGFMVAQLGLSALLIALRALGVPLETLNDSVFSSVIAAAVYTLTAVIVIGLPWLVIKYKTTRQELGLAALPTWMDILLTPLGLIVYLIISTVLVYGASVLFPAFDINQVQETGFSGIHQQYELVLAFLTLVILAPIAEEILFRGFLLTKLRRYVPLWIAVLVTSILFGALHGAWNVAIDTFALSIVLCVLRIKTNSLWAPILLHMTKNAIAFYLLFINPLLLNTIGG